MIDFFLFSFASVGMTLILVHGSLFQPLRQRLSDGVEQIQRRRLKKGLPPSFTLVEFFHGMIGCVQCTGFWCGVFCGLFLVTSDTYWSGFAFFLGPRYFLNRLMMLFCCGLASSFLAPVGNHWVDGLFFSKELQARQLMLANGQGDDLGGQASEVVEVAPEAVEPAED